MDASYPVPLDFELLVQSIYEAVLSPGDVAIDVGAHVGRHTIPLAQRVGTTGRVVAFEPVPSCRAELEQALHESHPDLAAHVELHPCALGAHVGQSEFIVAVDLPSYSGLRERTYDQPTRLERIPIAIKTLDDLTAAWPALRLIKIDAEGGETDILRGARQTLRRLRPVVVFEFGLRALENYDATPEAMFDLLRELDYDLYGIDGRLLDRESFTDSAFGQDICDYVAVPAEDAAAHAAVAETLHDQAIRLLKIQVYSTFAHLQAEAVGEVPVLKRYPLVLRPFVWCLAHFILFFAKVFLNPQRRANAAMLTALDTTLDALKNIEKRLQAMNRLARERQQKGGESAQETCRRDSAA